MNRTTNDKKNNFNYFNFNFFCGRYFCYLSYLLSLKRLIINAMDVIKKGAGLILWILVSVFPGFSQVNTKNG